LSKHYHPSDRNPEKIDPLFYVYVEELDSFPYLFWNPLLFFPYLSILLIIFLKKFLKIFRPTQPKIFLSWQMKTNLSRPKKIWKQIRVKLILLGNKAILLNRWLLPMYFF